MEPGTVKWDPDATCKMNRELVGDETILKKHVCFLLSIDAPRVGSVSGSPGSAAWQASNAGELLNAKTLLTLGTPNTPSYLSCTTPERPPSLGTIVTMLSRSIRRSIASPLRRNVFVPAVARPVFRTVTTDAASAHAEGVPKVRSPGPRNWILIGWGIARMDD